jgi:hypothetical protein
LRIVELLQRQRGGLGIEDQLGHYAIGRDAFHRGP